MLSTVVGPPKVERKLISLDSKRNVPIGLNFQTAYYVEGKPTACSPQLKAKSVQ